MEVPGLAVIQERSGARSNDHRNFRKNESTIMRSWSKGEVPMGAHRGSLRKSLISFATLFLVNTTGAFGQASPRLVEPVDNTKRITLPGNVHRLARSEYDRGAAPPDLQMDRLLLVLK